MIEPLFFKQVVFLYPQFRGDGNGLPGATVSFIDEKDGYTIWTDDGVWVRWAHPKSAINNRALCPIQHCTRYEAKAEHTVPEVGKPPAVKAVAGGKK